MYSLDYVVHYVKHLDYFGFRFLLQRFSLSSTNILYQYMIALTSVLNNLIRQAAHDFRQANRSNRFGFNCFIPTVNIRLFEVSLKQRQGNTSNQI